MSTPRLQTPQRTQLRFIPAALDDVLPAEHAVRDVWMYVEKLDMTVFYDAIRAVEGAPGRPPIDPRLLLGLWIFATTEAVGSARELAELCERDVPYMWLCGGVSVNYHTLADFRAKNEDRFRDLLHRHVTSLVATGVVQLDQVIQDGVRVRANAGGGSFRRRKSLVEIEKAVKEQIEALAAELHADPGASGRRKQAARKRALEQRAANVQAAITRSKEMDEQRLQATSHKSKKEQEKKRQDAETGETRASTTDADATTMKMADGGFRPAYNGQAAMDPECGFILDVGLTTEGNDSGQLQPMVDQIEKAYGCAPSAMIADGGYGKHRVIEDLEKRGIRVFTPVAQTRTPEADPHAPRDGDSPEIAGWRARMATDTGKATYGKRTLVEWGFARFRNWGLRQFMVRTRSRVISSFLLYALTHNLTNAMRLARQVR